MPIDKGRGDNSTFGRTLRELADQESDERKKAKLLRLASELELVFSRTANNVQSALGGAEVAWHARIDEVLQEIKRVQDVGADHYQLTQTVGAAVTDLADVVNNQGAAVVQLRIDFQAVAEQVSDLILDVARVKEAVSGLRRASLVSSAERARLADDGALLQTTVEGIIRQVIALSEQLNGIKHDLAGRPELIQRFLAVEAAVRMLQQKKDDG